MTLVSVLLAYFPFSKLMHMGGIFLSPTRNLANNNRAKRHVNPWNPAVKVHTYEEYEDEFRDKMMAAGLPVEKAKSKRRGAGSDRLRAAEEETGWSPQSEFRKGTFCYSALAKNLKYLGLPNPRDWQPFDEDWKLPRGLEEDHPGRHEGAAGEVPLVPPVHGHLRALRRLRRQVPLLRRLGRPEEHAGAARGADALGLPALLHDRRARCSARWPARAT